MSDTSSVLPEPLEELRAALPEILRAALDGTGPRQSSTMKLVAPHKDIQHCIHQFMTWASYHGNPTLLRGEDFIQTTAYLWICYAHDHPLIDGNKRFATHVAMTYLNRFGLTLEVSNTTLADFARDIIAKATARTSAEHTQLMSEVSTWISAHGVSVDEA